MSLKCFRLSPGTLHGLHGLHRSHPRLRGESSATSTAGVRCLNTAVLTHPCFEAHSNGTGHPESPSRMHRLKSSLQAESRRLGLLWLESDADVPRATRQQLVSAGHTATYVDDLMHKFERAREQKTSIRIDGDTTIGPGTGEAALRAAGAAIAAVDLVLAEDQTSTNAFVLSRPPGHHAERDRAMGFCFFGNVAAGIARARDAHGVRRVAVLDFDVHHGNGTQSLLWDDHDALFISIHESPLYPGSGSVLETGACENVINLPVPAGTQGDEVLDLVEGIVVPKLIDWDPEVLFFSAGFDAHADDQLANLSLKAKDFGDITRNVLAATVANAESSTRAVVSCLEGGYDLDALVDSATCHVAALVES